MSRNPEPGWISVPSRKSGAPWQKQRQASKKIRDPELLIHVRPLSSSKPRINQGNHDLACIKKSDFSPKRFLKSDVRSSLDRLNKKISSKLTSKGPVSSSGAARYRSIRDGKRLTTPDPQQIEGHQNDKKVPVIHQSASVTNISTTSSEMAAAESETISAWQLLHQAFQKYEDSTCYQEIVSASARDTNIELSENDDNQKWNMDTDQNCHEGNFETHDAEGKDNEDSDNEETDLDTSELLPNDISGSLSTIVNDNHSGNETCEDFSRIPTGDQDYQEQKRKHHSSVDLASIANTFERIKVEQCDHTRPDSNPVDGDDTDNQESLYNPNDNQEIDVGIANRIQVGTTCYIDDEKVRDHPIQSSNVGTCSRALLLDTEMQSEDVSSNAPNLQAAIPKCSYSFDSHSCHDVESECTETRNHCRGVIENKFDAIEICRHTDSEQLSNDRDVNGDLPDDDNIGTFEFDSQLECNDMSNASFENYKNIEENDTMQIFNAISPTPVMTGNLEHVDNLTTATCSSILTPSASNFDRDFVMHESSRVPNHKPDESNLEEPASFVGGDGLLLLSNSVAIEQPLDVIVQVESALDYDKESVSDRLETLKPYAGLCDQSKDQTLGTELAPIMQSEAQNEHMPKTVAAPLPAPVASNVEMNTEQLAALNDPGNPVQCQDCGYIDPRDFGSKMEDELKDDIEESNQDVNVDDFEKQSNSALDLDSLVDDPLSRGGNICGELNQTPMQKPQAPMQKPQEDKSADTTTVTSEDDLSNHAAIISSAGVMNLPQHCDAVECDDNVLNDELALSLSKDLPNASDPDSSPVVLQQPTPSVIHMRLPEETQNTTFKNGRSTLRRSRSLPSSAAFRRNAAPDTNPYQTAPVNNDKPVDLVSPSSYSSAVHISQPDAGSLSGIKNEQLSDEVRHVRDKIQKALSSAKRDLDSAPKPKAVIHRRRYRPRAGPEGSLSYHVHISTLGEGELKANCEPETKPANACIEHSQSEHGKQSGQPIYEVVAIQKTDQATQATDDRCCYEARCCRCPITFDLGTETIVNVSDVDVQCQVQYEAREVQCCTENVNATSQTEMAEVDHESVQTEIEHYCGHICTQTEAIESNSQQTQSQTTTMNGETQTIIDVVDAAVQHTELKPQSIASKASIDTDFADLDQHVNHLVRSLSPGRRFFPGQQNRPITETIEDPAKGVFVLEDGRPLRNSMNLGPRTLVSLNIGGQRFDVLRSTLMRYPETLLGRIASSQLPVYIDRNPILFPYIMNTYRSGAPYLPTTNQSIAYLESLRDEARFYQIETQMFPKGIEALTESRPEPNFPTNKNNVFEDEGQCNQFELSEQCVLVPGMSATFTPRTNETLILDTISGTGQLLLDVVHGLRPELNANSAVVFDSAAYLNAAEGDTICIETAYPHGASYTFFMLDRANLSSVPGTTNGDKVTCEFCGLQQFVEPSAGRLALCSSCHSRLPEISVQSEAEKATSNFYRNGRGEPTNQLTISMRIICTFDKSCRTKLATVNKKGNAAVLLKSAADNHQHIPPDRTRSPAKKSRKPAMFPDGQLLSKQRSTSPSAFKKQVKPSPLPLIRRPPMA